MIELLFSFLITVVPDYLYRRHKQGKRLGHEITLYNVWYELRWGITGCAVLAISLISVIFYFHPTTSNVTSLFRTVAIISDTPGRVAEVYVQNNQDVRAGDPIFRLDTRRHEAAAETARRQITEVEAARVLAESELAAAEGAVQSATAVLQQAEDELTRILNIRRADSGAAAARQEDAQRALVESRRGELKAVTAQRNVVQARKDTLLPAQRATAVAALAQAETEIEKSTVYAGTDGNLQQFKLKPGDIVNPILRPAGILVPYSSGVGRFQAGFGQISAQVVKVGMITEITCASKPLAVIPMVVTEVQGAIAGGQLRPTDQLIDIQDRRRPGTIMAILEPIYEGHADTIPPGSVCAGVAYTSRAAEREAGELTGLSAFTLHFLRILFADLFYAGPLLSFLLVVIALIGLAIGRIEGWSRLDALYHAFINATTVGYGDYRPTTKRGKVFAVCLAFVGLLFTGMIVAIALHAADYAYGKVYDTIGFAQRLER